MPTVRGEMPPPAPRTFNRKGCGKSITMFMWKKVMEEFNTEYNKIDSEGGHNRSTEGQISTTQNVMKLLEDTSKKLQTMMNGRLQFKLDEINNERKRIMALMGISEDTKTAKPKKRSAGESNIFPDIVKTKKRKPTKTDAEHATSKLNDLITSEKVDGHWSYKCGGRGKYVFEFSGFGMTDEVFVTKRSLIEATLKSKEREFMADVIWDDHGSMSSNPEEVMAAFLTKPVSISKTDIKDDDLPHIRTIIGHKYFNESLNNDDGSASDSSEDS